MVTMPPDDQLQRHIADLQRQISDLYMEMKLPSDDQLQQEFANLQQQIADMYKERDLLKIRLHSLDQSLSNVASHLGGRAASATKMAIWERVMNMPIEALQLSRPITNRLESDGSLVIRDLLRKSEHDLARKLELEQSQVEEVVERLRAWGLWLTQDV
jgi:DNA-directed RNA polymerase alpha subunit